MSLTDVQPAEESAVEELEEFKPSGKLLAAICSIAVVNLACALDATTISIALPAITSALHGTSIEAFWIGTAFLLASTVWQPNFVSFSHVFGRRPIFIFALFLFTLGAILCAVSHGMTLMLVGRVIQGSGVGGIMTLTETCITDLVPLRVRGIYISLISIVWAIGTLLGPILGGVLAQKNAWRWIFWLNLPIVAIGFVGVMMFLKLEQSKDSWRDKFARIDHLGSIFFVGSTTALLIPITWGGVMYSWADWRTLVPILVGVAGLVGFCIYETLFAEVALLPLEIFQSVTTSTTYFLTFIHGVILWSIVYYMALYFMGGLGYSPIIAGVAGLPQTLTVVPCAMLVGFIAAKTGKYRWGLWLGWGITTLGCGIMCLLDSNTPIVKWVFLLVIGGTGLGLLFPTMNLSIQASVPAVHVGTAAGMFVFFRAFGQTVGVAIGGVIFQNRIQRELKRYPDLLAHASDAVALIEQMRLSPLDSADNLVLRVAFTRSLRVVWAVMAGLAAVSSIASFAVKGYTLDRVTLRSRAMLMQERRLAARKINFPVRNRVWSVISEIRNLLTM